MFKRSILYRRSSKLVQRFAKLPLGAKMTDRDLARDIKWISNEIHWYLEPYQISYYAFDCDPDISMTFDEWMIKLDSIEYKIVDLEEKSKVLIQFREYLDNGGIKVIKDKRERLFKIYDSFMDNYYGENSTVEKMHLIIECPTNKNGLECPIRIDPLRQYFYNYINKAFSKDLCVMNYTDRYDISTGKPNEKHKIIGVKISYKNGVSDVIHL